MTFEGGVKVIDFGVAKAAGRAQHTRTGALKGKYSYMSPEQVSGREIDHRTDIFALGIVLHELLTALRLFKSDSDISTIERVKAAPIPPPSQLNPALPKGLDPIVLKALDRDPDKRYQTAQQFRLAIEDWLVQERQSASSAHLAEFLKIVYKERLELESRHGPMLGELEPQGAPIGGIRPSSSNTARLEARSIQGASQPFPAENKASTKVERPRDAAEREQRTPSRPTDPRPDEPSKKSVIDLSEIHTEKSTGPFKGRPALKYGVTAASVAAILALSIWMLSPKHEAPPAAVDAVLSVVTDPPGASISLDGRFVGTSPFDARVPAGRTARVEATLEGHQPAGRSVEVNAARQRVELKLLRNAPQLASLLVKSDPEGAEVSDGARILGHTPFNWQAARGETRTLTFRLAGFRDEEQRVTVTGAESDLAVRLRRLDPAGAQRTVAPQQPPQQQLRTAPPPVEEAIKLER